MPIAPKSSPSRPALVAARDAANRRHGALLDRHADLSHDAKKFLDAAAAEEAAKLEPQVAEAVAEIQRAEAALQAHDAQAAAAAEAERRRKAADEAQSRPRKIAEARHELRTAAQEVERGIAMILAGARKYGNAGLELSKLTDAEWPRGPGWAGLVGAGRQFRPDAASRHIMHGLSLGLATFSENGIALADPRHRFPLAHSWSRLTLLQLVDALLDGEAPRYFLDVDEAERTRLRLDPSGDSLHLARRADGVIALVAGRRRAPQGAA